jgi:hypothetical protein
VDFSLNIHHDEMLKIKMSYSNADIPLALKTDVRDVCVGTKVCAKNTILKKKSLTQLRILKIFAEILDI